MLAAIPIGEYGRYLRELFQLIKEIEEVLCFSFDELLRLFCGLGANLHGGVLATKDFRDIGGTSTVPCEDLAD